MAKSDNFIGKTPDNILTNPVIDHSSWHFFQALSWIDYAKRTQLPSAIHYAAFDLRYGIEYLLFEIVVLTNRTLTTTEYNNCLGDPKEMKKMIENNDHNYYRLCEFTEIALSVDAGGLKLRFWNLNELFRFWGTASEYLHFIGAQSMTYKDPNWIIKAIATLEAALKSLWNRATDTHGIGVLRPDLMPEEVHKAWVEFSNNKLSKEDLHLRLKLIQPVLQLRRINQI